MNSILNWVRPHPFFVFSFIQCTPKTSSSVKYFTVVTLINNRNIMGYDLRVLYCHKTIFVYLIMKKFLNSQLTGHCCLWEALQWWCFMRQDTTASYCLCRYVNTFAQPFFTSFAPVLLQIASWLNWPISLYKPDLEQLTDCNSSLDSDDDFHQVVDNSLSQNYPHLNDQTTQ